MSKVKIYLAMLLCTLMVVVGIGCAALSHYITPGDLDKDTQRYVVDHGRGNYSEEDYKSFLYPNLVDVQKLDEDLDDVHDMEQLRLHQKIDMDNQEYAICKKASSSNLQSGLMREETLFGEKGLLSLGLSLAGMGTLTGLLGLMRKRPGDMTPQDMEKAVAEVSGKTQEELTAKQKQFIQVVSGVSTLMKDWKTNNPQMYAQAKSIFNAAQDTETQVAVATAKKTSILG